MSFSGGTLWLFTGMSILSMFEIFCWLLKCVFKFLNISKPIENVKKRKEIIKKKPRKNIESVPKKMSQSFVSKHYGSEILIFMSNNDFVFRLNPIGQYLKPNLSHPKNIHTFSQSYFDKCFH